ncbi:MAG: DUF805 domain-containing protein [Gammaproteobacteria bacterium]
MKHFWAALKKYATFSGRASRAEYFYFIIPILLLAIVVGYGIGTFLYMGIEEEVQGMTDDEFNMHIHHLERLGQALSILVFLPFLLPILAVTVRRLHDYGWSGWWVLVVGFASNLLDKVAFAAMGDTDSIPANILLILSGFIAPIVVGLPESDTGKNKYDVPTEQEGEGDDKRIPRETMEKQDGK